MKHSSKTPEYRTVLFTDIWDDDELFLNEYKDSGLYDDTCCITDSNARILFFHLYAKYGNSPIANSDVNQFRYKVYSLIYQFGPTWEKELEYQKKIRSLTDSQIVEGSRNLFNHSFNPSTTPSTSTLEELETINEQNTQIVKRGKLESYAVVLDLLKTNVTGAFIEKFKPLFKQFVMPEEPVIYISEEDEEWN